MKKFLLYASAVSAMMLAGSCQKETIKPVSEGEVSVKFSIALPDGLQTKAMSKAEETDIVYYEIWNSDWSRQLYPVEEAGVQSAYASAEVKNCKADINLKLVSDQTYQLIFWAQNEGCGAYNVENLKNVGVDYNVIGGQGNQDKFDAFYKVETIKVEGPIEKTITLTRPFAQLNFGADEMTTTFGDIVVTATEVKVSELATVFNTIDGIGMEPKAVSVPFTATGLATTAEELVAGGKNYTWVTMDYMLMMNDDALVNIEASFGIEGMDLPVTHSITNVPLKKNHRTNIVGDLFTTDAKLDIIVDPDFLKPDEGPAVEITVSTAAELQDAVDAAEGGKTVIKLADDIEGDVVVTQKADVYIVIDGEGKSYEGVIVVDGKSATYTSAGLTISNLAFNADAISADACIRLGNGTNATRYTCNVAVENCTFAVPGAVGVKSYTGGDKNLTISGCTATAAAHSLLQAKGIDGILVKKCTINSKNGLNFNNSTNVLVDECNADVRGYAARFGEGSAANGGAEVYAISNSTLKSACDDGDAVIILRGTADNSTLTLTNTTLVGATEIANNAVNAQVIR